MGLSSLGVCRHQTAAGGRPDEGLGWALPCLLPSLAAPVERESLRRLAPAGGPEWKLFPAGAPPQAWGMVIVLQFINQASPLSKGERPKFFPQHVSPPPWYSPSSVFSPILFLTGFCNSELLVLSALRPQPPVPPHGHPPPPQPKKKVITKTPRLVFLLPCFLFCWFLCLEWPSTF